jgi:hypothetical protein
LVAAAVAALAGCGGSQARTPGEIQVTPAGRIGSLHVDRSTRADVIGLLGRPDAETSGRYVNYAPFDALGYGCKGQSATGRAGVPRCKTVFYLRARTGKLALLYASDSRFSYRGVHPGMPVRAVEKKLHRRPVTGCYDGYRVATETGFLVVWILSYGDQKGCVDFLAVHSPRLGVRDDPGVLDCIDS